MKSPTQRVARTVRIAALPLLCIAAGIVGQPALAGGNASGQPSGVTVAGSTTTPTASQSGLLSILLSVGPFAKTTTTTTSPTGVTTTTRTVTIPATALTNFFAGAGLSLPSPGSTTTYQGTTGVFTVTNNNGQVTVSLAQTSGS